MKFVVSKEIIVESATQEEAIGSILKQEIIMVLPLKIRPFKESDILKIDFKPPPALTQDKWPLWAKALKLIAKPEDQGLGDVIARTIGHENSEAFKAWYQKTFGQACGCAGRQVRLNEMYPLTSSS